MAHVLSSVWLQMGLLSLLLGFGSPSLHRALEEGPARAKTVNCRGCFNRTSGVCTIDTGNGRSCSNATRDDCSGLGEVYVDGDPNAWPAGGCLVQLAAKCLADLGPYECGSSAEKYTLHANTTDQCLRDAKAMGASVSNQCGWNSSTTPHAKPRPDCHAPADMLAKIRARVPPQMRLLVR